MATRIPVDFTLWGWRGGAALGFAIAAAYCLIRAALAASILLGWASFPSMTAMPMAALLSSSLCALLAGSAAILLARRSTRRRGGTDNAAVG